MRRAPLFLLLSFLPSLLTAATKTWNGAVDTKWSNGTNWVGGTPPAPGDDLVFDYAQRDGTNDLPSGTVFHSLTFVHQSATISGNAFGVTAGISVSAGFGGIINNAISLQGSQTWSGTVLPMTSVALGGYTLTLNGGGIHGAITGTGNVVVGGSTVFYGANTYSGTTTVNPGGVLGCWCCVIPGAVDVNGGRVAFDSSLCAANPSTRTGPLTSTGGTIAMDDYGAACGNVSLDSASTFEVHFVLDSSQDLPLRVAGTVSLGDAALILDVRDSSSVPGGTVYRLIDNDGTDPVSGTFHGIPEGPRSPPYLPEISYHGGTGNDVTATYPYYPRPTQTSLTASPNPAYSGQAVTLTATVTPYPNQIPGDPLDGTVTFFERGATSNVAIGQAPVTASGTASITTSSLAPGTHTIFADFSATTGHAYVPSHSPDVVVVVRTISGTSTGLSAQPNPTHAGEKTTLTANVISAGGTPTGSVTFYDGAAALATAPLTAGAASALVGPLARGLHSISAAYVPDTPSFTASTSVAISLNVDVAAVATSTQLDVTPESSMRSEAVTLTASVSAASDGGTPLGSVIFFDGSDVLDTVPLNGGIASIVTRELSSGTHMLAATFVPLTSVYGASTSQPVTHVVAEPPAKRRAAGH